MNKPISPELRQEMLSIEQARPATVREMFAMAALTGMLASGIILTEKDAYAKAAWRHADACLRIRPMAKIKGVDHE